MDVILRGHDLPGLTCDVDAGPYANVHVGVQRGRDVVELKPGDAPSVEWTIAVDLARGRDGARDFKGPYVHGKRGDRFLYLSWGVVGADGAFTMFRRAKLMLAAIDPALLDELERGGGALLGALGMTLPNGTPVCAALRPPRITWSRAPAARG